MVIINFNHHKNVYKVMYYFSLSNLVTQEPFAIYLLQKYMELTDTKVWISKNVSLCQVFIDWVTLILLYLIVCEYACVYVCVSTFVCACMRVHTHVCMCLSVYQKFIPCIIPW